MKWNVAGSTGTEKLTKVSTLSQRTTKSHVGISECICFIFSSFNWLSRLFIGLYVSLYNGALQPQNIHILFQVQCSGLMATICNFSSELRESLAKITDGSIHCLPNRKLAGFCVRSTLGWGWGREN